MHARTVNFSLMMGFILINLFSHSTSTLLNLSIKSNLIPSCRDAVSNLASLSIDDKLGRASHVLVGKVENIESKWDNEAEAIFTYIKTYIEERIKGTIQNEYAVIKHKGGEFKDIGQWVSSEPSFFVGEKVKVFLRREEAGEFTVLDGFKGKISLSSPASSGYSYAGFHWTKNDLPVPYYINQDGTSDVSGTDEFQAVRASFQAWEDDPESFMDYTYMDTTTLSNESLNGYNVVSWLPIDGPEGTLAQTSYWYNPSTLLLTEFDIVLDEDETWSATGESGKHDVQNVCTHEVGHTLVLDDLYDSADSEQTMYGYSSPGETKKRTLEAGDRAGIRFIYPEPKPLYMVTTNPVGLQIEVDGINYITPQSFEWILDSTHTVYAPSTQNGSIGTRYFFTGWSDQGTQQHEVTMGTSSVTVTANYVTQHLAKIETHGLGLTYPATINYIQLGGSQTSFISNFWSDWCDSSSSLNIDSYVVGEEGERWITYDATDWLINSTLIATVNYILQYRVSIVFKTYDDALTIQPTQVQILGAPPNNTLLTLESYSLMWLDNITWTLKQVLWRNSNVIPLNAPPGNLSREYVWTVTCRIYTISFDSAFKNFKGLELNEKPSFFVLQFPNGTVSEQLSPFAVNYIQNGTTQWKSIIWQGVDVAPPNFHFDATDGNPVVNCLVYDFVIKVLDVLGLPVAGAQVSVAFANGKIVNTQTGPDGVVVVQMVPQGKFAASISYLVQTVSVSGDANEAALKPVSVVIAFGLSALMLLLTSCGLIVALIFFLMLRRGKSIMQQVE